LAEVVSYADGRVLPDRCLSCGDIPDSLLPAADLGVTSLVERHEQLVGPRPVLRAAA
jgi:hypothetical protein